MESIGVQAVTLAVCPPSVPVTGPGVNSSLMKSLFDCVVGLFKIEFTLFGVTFSFWQVFLFIIAASITIWIVRELFLSD